MPAATSPDQEPVPRQPPSETPPAPSDEEIIAALIGSESRGGAAVDELVDDLIGGDEFTPGTTVS